MKCPVRLVVAAGCVLAAGQLLDAADGDAGRGDRDQLFQRLDTDGDGTLSKSEIPEEQQRMFERLLRNGDKNGDGKLSKDEFAASTKDDRQPRRPEGAGGGDGPQPDEIFRRGDANGDGKLERDEVPEERREMFDRMVEHVDANGDKALSLEEFRKGIAMARGGAAPSGQSERRPEGAGSPGTPDGLFAVLDKNHDGKLSSEELYSAAETLKRLDKDGDGSVSRQEALTAGRKGDMPGRPTTASGRPGEGGQFAEMMLARFKQADANNDGKLTKDEAPDRMRENFDRIDQNGDGFIDADEMKQVIQMLARSGGGAPGQGGGPGGGDMAKQLLQRADANGDGKLSKDEVPERMRENFDRMDRNGDGFLEPQELQAMRRPGNP
ncbi:MAG TPA: EF-hand domain-containing protein [Pirellulales bacterium]|nr:EF-hand domain-containing protein [Pirellulales bacterium]